MLFCVVSLCTSSSTPKPSLRATGLCRYPQLQIKSGKIPDLSQTSWELKGCGRQETSLQQSCLKVGWRRRAEASCDPGLLKGKTQTLCPHAIGSLHPCAIVIIPNSVTFLRPRKYLHTLSSPKSDKLLWDLSSHTFFLKEK